VPSSAGCEAFRHGGRGTIGRVNRCRGSFAACEGGLGNADLAPLRVRLRAPPHRVQRLRCRDGVLLSGYFGSEIGLGQSARLFSSAMDKASVLLSM
jgi:hypothetical protein